MMRRIGWNVLGQFLNPAQRAKYLNHIAQQQPRVVVVMDEVALAQATREASQGKTLVFHRIYHKQDATYWRWLGVKEFCDHVTMNGTISRDIGVIVGNEPDTRGNDLAKLLTWLVDVGDELADRGYHAVMGNIGPGTVETDTIESGVFANYLRRLAEWSAVDQHYGGWHEYAPILLPMGVGRWPVEYLENPSLVQPVNWPVMNMMQARIMRAQALAHPIAPTDGYAQLVYPGYWWLYRSEWFNLWAEEQGIGRHKIVLTEFGWDRMGDLAQQMPRNIYQKLEAIWGAVGYQGLPAEIRGPRTLENVWRGYFPNWSFDEAAFRQLQWADGIYPDNYIGMCLFCWAFDGPIEKEQNWERLGYNLGDLTELQARLIAAGAEDNPPAPLPVPEPEPEPSPEPEEEAPEPVGCSPVAQIAAGVMQLVSDIRARWASSLESQSEVQEKENLVNVPEIFTSKRFWSAVVGLVMMVATSLIPELEQHADTLIPAILLVISLLIGGYAAEDYATAKGAAAILVSQAKSNQN